MGQYLTLKEIQVVELGIMDFLHDVCEKNGLCYYLVGGTLIGAIRHKGFIPWDDDIDISMPRADYEKLKKIMQENDDPRYKLLHDESDDNYYSFGKMVDTRTQLIEKEKGHQIPNMGVYLDIFPLDGIPESELSAKLHYKNIKFWDKLLMQYGYASVPKTDNVIRYIYRFVYWKASRIFGLKKLNFKIRKVLNRHKFEDSKFICNYFGAYGLREKVPAKLFKERVLVEFENRQYYAPYKYDDYLKLIYGNYMELPPVEKRVSRHDIDVLWKE